MRLVRIMKDATLASAKKVAIVGDVGRYWKRGEDYAGIVRRNDKYYYVDKLYNILACYDDYINVSIIYPYAQRGIEKLQDDSRVEWTRLLDSRLVKDSGYRIGRNRRLNDNRNNDLSIHEIAALAFYLRYDMGFHFDELKPDYSDEEDMDTAYYNDIRYHERNNDRAFFDDIMNAYYSSKEDYEDVLEDAVRDYESYDV